MEKGFVESRMRWKLHVRFGGSFLVISPDENKKTGQPLPIVQVYRKKTSYLTLIVQVYTGSKGETRIATLLLPPSLLLFVFASVIENGAGILTVLE